MANNFCQATVSPYLPAQLFTESERETLSLACGLDSEVCGEQLYFYADTYFREFGEYEDDGEFDSTAFFQQKLRRLDPLEYPHIVIHGAATCNKLRADEFGGLAFFITRETIKSISTWKWLDEQQRNGVGDVSLQPYSILLLYPDYLDDTGYETFYAFVEAADPIDAVATAQRQAATAQACAIDDPTDFHPLLVTAGHHASKPLFNK